MPYEGGFFQDSVGLGPRVLGPEAEPVPPPASAPAASHAEAASHKLRAVPDVTILHIQGPVSCSLSWDTGCGSASTSWSNL